MQQTQNKQDLSTVQGVKNVSNGALSSFASLPLAAEASVIFPRGQSAMHDNSGCRQNLFPSVPPLRSAALIGKHRYHSAPLLQSLMSEFTMASGSCKSEAPSTTNASRGQSWPGSMVRQPSTSSKATPVDHVDDSCWRLRGVTDIKSLQGDDGGDDDDNYSKVGRSGVNATNRGGNNAPTQSLDASIMTRDVYRRQRTGTTRSVKMQDLPAIPRYNHMPRFTYMTWNDAHDELLLHVWVLIDRFLTDRGVLSESCDDMDDEIENATDTKITLGITADTATDTLEPRIRCCYRTKHGHTLRFVISFYRQETPDGMQLIVEVQRRQGCSVDMHRFRKALFEHVQQTVPQQNRGYSQQSVTNVLSCHTQQYTCPEWIKFRYDEERNQNQQRQVTCASQNSKCQAVGNERQQTDIDDIGRCRELLCQRQFDQNILGLQYLVDLTDESSLSYCDSIAASVLCPHGETTNECFYNSLLVLLQRSMTEVYSQVDARNEGEDEISFLALQVLANALQSSTGTANSLLFSRNSTDTAKELQDILEVLMQFVCHAQQYPCQASIALHCLDELFRRLMDDHLQLGIQSSTTTACLPWIAQVLERVKRCAWEEERIELHRASHNCLVRLIQLANYNDNHSM